jgi:hypothetical protein
MPFAANRYPVDADERAPLCHVWAAVNGWAVPGNRVAKNRPQRPFDGNKILQCALLSAEQAS